MKLLILSWIAVVSATFPTPHRSSFSHTPLHDVGEPLILTSYLEQNKIEEARSAAKVQLDIFRNITSYSGYFTVDKINNSNLFFWFFPSTNDYTNDPVILWLQGGPGESSLLGLFTEHGPFSVSNGYILTRDVSWHKNHSVIYVDQPINTGFSFSNGTYVTSEEEIAEHLYTFLNQFFILFPELQENEFYVAGESYAGKFAPAISYAIHQNNPSASTKINLKGLLIGNGFSDPINQLNYGDLLYQIGLIDLQGLSLFKTLQNAITESIQNEIYDTAASIWQELVETLFHTLTRLNGNENFLKSNVDIPTDWETFVVEDEIRKAIHVGSQSFYTENEKVLENLYSDLTKSVKTWISELLSNYKILLFSGQLDIIVAYVLTENYIQNLDFNGAIAYRTATRNIWTVGNKVAGYVKTGGNLTEVLVRDAGHRAAMDQPEYVYELISKFTRNMIPN